MMTGFHVGLLLALQLAIPSNLSADIYIYIYIYICVYIYIYINFASIARTCVGFRFPVDPPLTFELARSTAGGSG